MPTLHCTVSGRVQGVFFRAWTRDTARSLGLTGWVRNKPDGTVELMAQGDEQSLEKLRKKLHQGPAAARVEDVACSVPDSSDDFSGFEIKH